MSKWYKLDNIGAFYALTSNKKIAKVFRYSAYIKDDIDPKILQKALQKTLKTFPNFNVNLKKGLYWYYLDTNSKEFQVTEENLPVCFKLYHSSEDLLYRVSFFKNKINLEISHIISDGRGSIDFFKMLIENYVSLKYNLKLTLPNKNSELEKSEDSFLKYYHKSKFPKKTHEPVYIYKNRKFHNETQFLDCQLKLPETLKLAHEYDTTLTIFLVSALIYSFKEVLKTSELKKSIRIDIPVDLRSFFKSNTTMNFFGLTNISYKFNEKNETLEDIIKSVKEKFQTNINAEKLSERVNLMVSLKNNWFCRLSPLLLKIIVLNIADKLTTNSSTTSFSNLGQIKFNELTTPYIKRLSVFTSTENFQFTVSSYQDIINIGISNRFVNNEVVKNFCRFLANKNLIISIDESEVKR